MGLLFPILLEADGIAELSQSICTVFTRVQDNAEDIGLGEVEVGIPCRARTHGINDIMSAEATELTVASGEDGGLGALGGLAAESQEVVAVVLGVGGLHVLATADEDVPGLVLGNLQSIGIIVELFRHTQIGGDGGSRGEGIGTGHGRAVDRGVGGSLGHGLEADLVFLGLIQDGLGNSDLVDPGFPIHNTHGGILVLLAADLDPTHAIAGGQEGDLIVILYDEDRGMGAEGRRDRGYTCSACRDHGSKEICLGSDEVRKGLCGDAVGLVGNAVGGLYRQGCRIHLLDGIALISQCQETACVGIGILLVGGHGEGREVRPCLYTAVCRTVEGEIMSMAGNQQAHIHLVEDLGPFRKYICKIGLSNKGDMGEDHTLGILSPSAFGINLLQPTGLLYTVGLEVDGVGNICVVIGVAAAAI